MFVDTEGTAWTVGRNNHGRLGRVVHGKWTGYVRRMAFPNQAAPAVCPLSVRNYVVNTYITSALFARTWHLVPLTTDPFLVRHRNPGPVLFPPHSSSKTWRCKTAAAGGRHTIAIAVATTE